jgi:hypothetical protein
LKTKTFISQKSLDTPVFRLIRFAQKVLTDFKAPLELFSLEEEAALLPGGLFVYVFISLSWRKLLETQRSFYEMELWRAFCVSTVVSIL